MKIIQITEPCRCCRNISIDARPREWATVALGLIVAFTTVSCSRDVRLADRKLRDPKVGEVTQYGVKLDKQALPEHVAFVLLQAIRDDAKAPDQEAREKALDVQFSLCAADEISRRNRSRTSRQEHLYNVVSRWTPTVAHYVDSFPSSWDEAKSRLVSREHKLAGDSSSGIATAEVSIEVEETKGEPRARAVMMIWMAKEAGFWRVTHLGFQQGKRSIDPQITSVSTEVQRPAGSN